MPGTESGDGVVDARLDEHGRALRARGQVAGAFDRGGGEVEAGDLDAQALERDGVGADVALQVHGLDAVQVTESVAVEGDDVGEPGRIVDVRPDGVLALIEPRRT